MKQLTLPFNIKTTVEYTRQDNKTLSLCGDTTSETIILKINGETMFSLPSADLLAMVEKLWAGGCITLKNSPQT